MSRLKKKIISLLVLLLFSFFILIYLFVPFLGKHSSSFEARINPLKYSGFWTTFTYSFLDMHSYLKKNGFKHFSIVNELGHSREGFIYAPSSFNQNTDVYLCTTGVGGLWRNLSNDSISAVHRVCTTNFISSKPNSIIILLDNSLSHTWIRQNKIVLLSGWEAGWDLLWTIKEIQKKFKFSPEQLKPINISLGGNDYLYALALSNLIASSPQVFPLKAVNLSSPIDRYQAIGFFIDYIKQHWYPKNVLERVILSTEEYFFERHQIKVDLDRFRHQTVDENLISFFLPEIEYSKNNFFSEQQQILEKTLFKNSKNKLDKLSQFKLETSDTNVFKNLEQEILFIHAENDPMVSIKNFSSFFSDLTDKNHAYKLISTQWGGHVCFELSYGQNWITNTILNHFTSDPSHF